MRLEANSAGRIEVRTRREQRDGRASIVLTVEDNGQGIPAYVLPDIFDAFVTTRLDAHGTGLGLTVVGGHHHAARRYDRRQQSPAGRSMPGNLPARSGVSRAAGRSLSARRNRNRFTFCVEPAGL